MKIEGGPFTGGELTVTKRHDKNKGTVTKLTIEKEGIVLSIEGATPAKVRELASSFIQTGNAVASLGHMLNNAVDGAVVAPVQPQQPRKVKRN